MGLGIAFRAFFASLSNRQTAEQISCILSGEKNEVQPHSLPPSIDSPPAPGPVNLEGSEAGSTDARDSAVTLLATLQREARLVDLVQEDLAAYSDAQVGAAARPCLNQCRDVLNRVMALKPILEAQEGETVEVGENASPLRYQWIGEGTPTSGKLVHHGWEASKVELPAWTGDASNATVVAAAQIQSV